MEESIPRDNEIPPFLNIQPILCDFIINLSIFGGAGRMLVLPFPISYIKYLFKS